MNDGNDNDDVNAEVDDGDADDNVEIDVVSIDGRKDNDDDEDDTKYISWLFIKLLLLCNDDKPVIIYI